MLDYGVIPEGNPGRTTCVLIFNRLSGVFIAATSLPISKCDTTSPTIAYIEEEFDLVNDVVDGKLDVAEDGTYEKNYVVRDRNDGPTDVFESQLDNQMAYKITKKYPLAEQVNILGRSIVKLAEEAKVELPELEELLDYIKLVKDTNRTQKEFYRDSEHFNYITKKQAAEDEVARFEGGLHEQLGPRAIEGGSVFG